MQNWVLLLFYFFWAFLMNAQNQLPLANASLEEIEPGTNNFVYWSNLQTNGGQVNYSIETENLIPGSSRAQKSEIISLGSNGWHVKTHSDYLFQVQSGQQYTVRFWAKVEGNNQATVKVVFQSEVQGSYQGNNKTINENWQQFSHTFTVSDDSDLNRLSFWYMDSGVTYYLDQVEVVVGKTISLNEAITYQEVDGFGAGIKRRTEHLYDLEVSLRNQIETLAFQDLEVNMIRFFIYHDLEDPNDNNNPFTLNQSALDWTRYDSDPNNWRTRYIGEALNSAFSLSINGFDHIIGNCNSAPAWMKTNGSHTNGGTLIPGFEDEYSEFLIGFLTGMSSRYNIDVTAISPTNEPDFEVSYESMNTTPEELSSILINLNNRLDDEGFSQVKVISPECFRVDSDNPSKSTTNYVNTMFEDLNVFQAVDIVATHPYQSSVTQDQWSNLKDASLEKPIWVTEAGNLGSPYTNMADASYHIERIIDGFNNGGLTAYMFHLFYEQHDYDNEISSSALVLWDSNNNILLPKRYYVFKHFANLIKGGYQRIHSSGFDNDLKIIAFKSDDDSKVIVNLFSEGSLSNVNIEIPEGAISVEHFVTSDQDENFSLTTSDDFDLDNNYMSLNLGAMSMHSFVFSIDSSLSSNNDFLLDSNKVILFPNPAKSQLELSFRLSLERELIIYDVNGLEVLKKIYPESNKIILNTEFLSSGFYFLNLKSKNGEKTVKFLINNDG